MEGFPLLRLNPDILEQVIKKTQSQAYFRLQQTCKDVNRFIRTCHTSIHIPLSTSRKHRGEYTLSIDSTSAPLLFAKGKAIDMKVLYGTRIGAIYTNYIYSVRLVGGRRRDAKTGPKAFEDFCKTLKNNRVTCEGLVVEDGMLNKDQCSTLIKILRPVKIYLDSSYSNRYATLFNAKGLKTIGVRVDSVAAATMLLFTCKTCPRVRLDVDVPFSHEFNLLHSILETISSMSWSSPYQFSYQAVLGRVRLPSKQELEQEFGNYQLKVEGCCPFSIFARVELPHQCPSGSFFKMSLHVDSPPYSFGSGMPKRTRITCSPA